MSAAFSLPQPPSVAGQAQRGRRPYKYVPYDVLETDWLGDPRRLLSYTKNGGRNCDVNVHHVQTDNILHEGNARYARGTLVWVLLSKGKPKNPAHNAQSGYNALALHRKRRDKKNKRMSNNSSGKKRRNQGNEKNDDPTKEATDTYSKNSENQKHDADNDNAAVSLNQSRTEFFLRARVLSDDEEMKSDAGGGEQSTSIRERNERRVLVRYSKGSTYRVRACNLIPILEPGVHDIDRLPESSTSHQRDGEEAQQSKSMALPPMVILVPETNIYRRIAKVHTTPDDSFMEIGCDYGITVNKIQTSLEEAGDVPKVWPPKDGNRVSDGVGEAENKKVSCLGVDKSKESIDIANERYPKCKFSLANILVKEEMSSIRTLCEQALVGTAPSIICIDVNGNREISGVVECLRIVMNEEWTRQPRMIIVKSRFLYWELKKMEGVGVNVSAP